MPGGSKTLSCSFASGNPVGYIKVRWMKDDQVLSANYSNKYTGLDTLNLTIDRLESIDNGEYKFLVSNHIKEMCKEDATSFLPRVYGKKVLPDNYGGNLCC